MKNKKAFIINLIFVSSILLFVITTPFSVKKEQTDSLNASNKDINSLNIINEKVQVKYERAGFELVKPESAKNIELTEKQNFVLDNMDNLISGNSLIFGDIINVSIFDYIYKVSEYLELRTSVPIDSYIVLALLAQESRLSADVNKDGIAQIYIGEDVWCSLDNGEKLTISIENKQDAVRSIEWTIVSYVGNYQRLLDYRSTISNNPSISPLYVFKLHNSGNNLRVVRSEYSYKYPLTKEGDEKFLRTFESFEGEGLEMFKSYLKHSGANNVLKRVEEVSSYEEYTSGGNLFSDPKYIKNVLEYYVKEAS